MSKLLDQFKEFKARRKLRKRSVDPVLDPEIPKVTEDSKEYSATESEIKTEPADDPDAIDFNKD